MAVANERTLRDLEYVKVKDIIKSYASSPLGREWIEELAPSANPAVIKVRLSRLEELRLLLEEEGFSMGAIHDLRPILEQARQSTSLPPEDFLPVLGTIRNARLLKEQLYELGGRFPRLNEIAQGIGAFRELEENIARAIDNQGGIKEGASPQLGELTARRRMVEEQIKKALQRILQAPELRNMIQDTVITRRGSRLVIPIKASARHELDWVVQDSSDSGQTLYVEPPTVVEKNNQLRELEGEIREEQLRMLKELTNKLKAESRKIQKTIRALGILDGVYASARYAQELRCTTPKFNLHHRLRLIGARHPLLPQKSVVPIDISFGAGDHGVLITGPNTGGKTVTLKTIGLLTLMAQSGLQIPASSDSELAIFNKLRSDIGSEESIEQSLSTFSSHMRNIIGVLGEADRGTLVLLDELGAGTDPQEGAALGIALLRFLLPTGARMAVTTHFSALRRFAYQDPRLRTCSVEFDVATLSPTYHILAGVGASNALIVAERLGLNGEIVKEARRIIPQGEVHLEEIIRDLQQERTEVRRKRGQLDEKLAQAHRLQREYEGRLRQLEEEKEEALSGELRQLESLLREAKRSLEEALHRSREAQPGQKLEEVLEVEGQLQEAKLRLAREESPLDLADLTPGQRVFLRGAEKVGTVGEIIDGKRIEVELGGVRVWAKLSDLLFPPEDSPKRAVHPPRPSFELSSRPAVKLELSVHGLSAVEALHKLDRYLDRLLLSDVSRGYIIHGKGSGTLRRAIRDHLKGLPFVKDFYPAPLREGGEGVTVVELDVNS